jgi:hypothetical protein
VVNENGTARFLRFVGSICLCLCCVYCIWHDYAETYALISWYFPVTCRDSMNLLFHLILHPGGHSLKYSIQIYFAFDSLKLVLHALKQQYNLCFLAWFFLIMEPIRISRIKYKDLKDKLNATYVELLDSLQFSLEKML